MDRRTVLAALAAFAASRGAGGQAGRPRRIGLLSMAGSAADFPERQTLDALRALGLVDGGNVVVERRYAGGDSALLAQYAAELVRLKVDVILTFSAGVGAAKRATDTIPIVFGTSQDPVRTGFVASLARPGGNLTGATFLTDELAGKRLALLKAALPGISRAAVLWEPAHIDNEFRGMQAAAPEAGIELQSLPIPRPARPDEAERAVRDARDGRAEALVVAPGGFTIAHRKRIIALAAESRLPVISAWRIFADVGALLTYGPDHQEIPRRIAEYVDRVLKGASPAGLPVEQPTKFELVVNLRAAGALGIALPPALRIRADDVIQ